MFREVRSEVREGLKTRTLTLNGSLDDLSSIPSHVFGQEDRGETRTGTTLRGPLPRSDLPNPFPVTHPDPFEDLNLRRSWGHRCRRDYRPPS